MKKILCFSLVILILFISIFIYCPFYVCADTDKTVLSKSSDSPFGYSSSEAQNYVSAHLDIYDSDNNLLFSYTPTSTYNWTYSAKGKDNLHLSDNQLKAFLMSKKTLSAYAQLMLSGFSNNNVTRGFLSALGIATTGNSNALTDVSDKLLGNYNYINSINYDEDTQTITMDNTSVDKLREEIKKYYYDSIGIVQYNASGTFSDYINGRYFSHLFEYDEDYGEALSKVKNYKYALADSYINGNVNTSEHAYLWDSSSYIYLSDIKGFAGTSSYGNVVYRLNVYSDGVSSNFIDNLTYYYYYGINNNSYSTFKDNIYGIYIDPNGSYYNKIYPCLSDKTESFKSYFNYIDAYPCFCYTDFKFYSYDGSPLQFFKSFSAMYNFLNGDQNAYLSSEVKKTGEDITFSIKDMNENLGEKMDALIDSINSGKGNMSADELQNAIDKGIEDLNKNTEDIKDNTSDILDVLKEQNQILLDILGVTTNIYKVVKESDSKEKTYNINYVQSVFNSMFKGLKNAVFYGENTVRDDVSEDSDDIDSIVSDIPPDKKNYHNGLFGRFPFSVPYQLFDWLQALYVDPVAPKFTLSYAYLFKDLGYETNNFDFIIDLGDEKYSKWIELVRSGEKLSFIIYMAIATYHRFKNEI